MKTMQTIEAKPGTYGRRIWLEVNERVRISSCSMRRIYQDGLRLADLDLVLQYGERLVEGYYLSDNALNQAFSSLCEADYPEIRDRLNYLHHLVVVEMMGTVLATYRAQNAVAVEEGPQQCEFVMH